MGPDGSQIGIVSTQDALRQAQDLDLDLVEVAPQANPPVARIMDYGKHRFEASKKVRDARKNETRIMVKPDAPELLRKTFLSPRWTPELVSLSGNTDCYQPA